MHRPTHRSTAAAQAPRFAGSLLALALLPPPVAAAAPLPGPANAQADSLLQVAIACEQKGTVDSRLDAVAALHAAVRVAPDRPELWFELGRLHLAGRQGERARTCLERAAELAPDDAIVQGALGGIWKQYWLATQDTACLSTARGYFVRAVTLAPHADDAIVELSALEIMRGRPFVAAALAHDVYARDSTRADALLALGCAYFRSGNLRAAGATFEEARPKLEPALARRFNDERWFLGDLLDRRGATKSGLPASTRAYWNENDPDLTTPENEAHLDFESRLALALLLFRAGHEVRWDERTEIFVRYGPPDAINVNPVTRPTEYQYPRRTWSAYAPEPMAYPYDVQVWHYSELGMNVELWDFSLTGHFGRALSDGKEEAEPSPAALAERPELAALADGRGVFRALPPGTHALPLRSLVSRFPAGAGSRLLVHVAAPGTPAETLRAACAVMAEDGRVVARQSGPLGVSACAPAEERGTEFAVEVPEGGYRVDLSVNDGHGGRGLAHRQVEVGPPATALALSDLVLLCGGAAAVGATSIRLEPSFTHRVARGQPLSAYFELAHLARGRDGQSSFEYVCTVRPARGSHGGARGEARTIRVSRQETFAGPLRRQFLSVPVASLPAGDYELLVEVRDLVGEGEARGSTTFTRE